MRPYSPVSRLTRRQFSAQATMLRLLASAMLVVLLGLVLLASDLAHAQGMNPVVARFDGGIGSQVWARNNATNEVVDNDVFGVRPGGRPWVIERLTATANTNRIRVNGRGLLLAGGNGVGTAGGQSVQARLFCNGIAHNSALVPLDENGDFRIDSAFVDGNAPNPCVDARLLIVSSGGSWFAAGIPKR